MEDTERHIPQSKLVSVAPSQRKVTFDSACTLVQIMMHKLEYMQVYGWFSHWYKHSVRSWPLMVLHSWSLPPYSSTTPFLSTEDLALSSTVNPAFKASATQPNRPTSKLDNTNKNPINKKFLVQNKLLFCLVPTWTKNRKKHLSLLNCLPVHSSSHPSLVLQILSKLPSQLQCESIFVPYGTKQTAYYYFVCN